MSVFVSILKTSFDGFLTVENLNRLDIHYLVALCLVCLLLGLLV